MFVTLTPIWEALFEGKMSWAPYLMNQYNHENGWGRQTVGGYQDYPNLNPESLYLSDNYVPWNQGPYANEPNPSYTSWPTSYESSPPSFQNFDECRHYPVEENEEMCQPYIPPYQSALDELLAQNELMAQNLEANQLALDKVLAQAIAMMAPGAKDVTYIEDQTDKNTFHVTSYENDGPWKMSQFSPTKAHLKENLIQ